MHFLFADFEWKGLISLIVFILIYILNHFLGGDKKKVKPARPAREGAPQSERTAKPVPPNRQAAPDAARPNQKQEIEAFLQRAKDRRRDKTAPQRPAATPPRRLVETPLEAEVVKPRQLGASIASQQLDTRDVSEHAEHLTDDLTEADKLREMHRRKVFGHRVGRLEDTSSEVGAKAGEDATSTNPTGSATAAAAASVPVSSAFFQPKDIRQAIIVSEVLQRPEHRW